MGANSGRAGAGFTVCPTPGCPELTPGGRCKTCRAAAERRRGTSTQRGYGGRHRSRFRPAVLARDPVCVICRKAPATVADHYPLSRRQLAARGLDPDDPQHGRGVCKPCHDKSTARRQPGGFNVRPDGARGQAAQP